MLRTQVVSKRVGKSTFGRLNYFRQLYLLPKLISTSLTVAHTWTATKLTQSVAELFKEISKSNQFIFILKNKSTQWYLLVPFQQLNHF